MDKETQFYEFKQNCKVAVHKLSTLTLATVIVGEESWLNVETTSISNVNSNQVNKKCHNVIKINQILRVKVGQWTFAASVAGWKCKLFFFCIHQLNRIDLSSIIHVFIFFFLEINIKYVLRLRIYYLFMFLFIFNQWRKVNLHFYKNLRAILFTRSWRF